MRGPIVLASLLLLLAPGAKPPWAAPPRPTPAAQAGINRAALWARLRTRIPTAQASSTHITVSGRRGPIKISGKEQIYINFQPGGVIEGGGEHGIHIENSKGIKITGPPDGYGLVRGYPGRGIWIQNCRGVIISRVHVQRCGRKQNEYGGPPGFLIGQTIGVIVEWCKASENGTHGVYMGDSNDDAEVSDCQFWLNGSCGVQVNAVSANHPPGGSPSTDNWSDNVYVVRNHMWDNGPNGTGGINLMGIRKLNCYDNWIRRAKNGIALSNNGVAGRGANGLHFHGNLVEALNKPAFTATPDSGTQALPNGLKDNVWISQKANTPSKWCKDEGGNRSYRTIGQAQSAGAVPAEFVNLGR